MNIVNLIAERADSSRLALIANETRMTFGELLERAGETANWLRKQEGFQHQGIPRVGLSCANGIDYIILALGILKAGGCLVPLADELTATEREELMERTRLHGVLEDEGRGRTWRSLDLPDLENEEEFSALEPAFIRFSSGTTGRSKGVVLSHRKLLERITAANAALEIGPEDRVLWMLPMAHHFAVSIVLYLYFGACTVLGESRLAEDVLELAEKTEATVVYGSPFHHALLAADVGDYAWPTLRLAVSTAAPLPMATARAFRERFGKSLVQGLGIIEIGLPLLNTGGAGDFPDAVGRPLPSFEVEFRDDEGLPVAAGRIGELWIKGPGMFDAYLSPWQRVEEVCVDGWFATGDLAEIRTEGWVFLKGRKKSVLNISGMKVFPEEIEAVLNAHPSVKRSRVFGMEHAMFGTVPLAEVILDERVSSRELLNWCKRSLSAFKVPVRITEVDSLPLTASGKVKR
ncbi:MAG: class I adenylate-forming enzyme family protein [Luteolibacter sp.]